MDAQNLPLVPFGKYKGQPITTLMNDTKYFEWCKQQEWFKKFPIVYNICVNQTITTNNQNSKTTEQNIFLKPIYKFDINLIKLSKNKNLEIAKTEWREIYSEQRKEKTGVCICQHTLKNIIYMYNIYTKYTISVGTGCCKKFKLQIIKLNNNILENVMRKMLTNCEYTIIDNILEYANNIQIELINYIRNEYKKVTNLEQLKKLNNDIKILINEYDLKYLQDIYDEITDKIISEELIEFERKQKELIEYLKEKKNSSLIKIKEKNISLIKIKEKKCYRCNTDLENVNTTKYDDEITKKGVLFACNICSSLIDCWLERGCEEQSFNL